jgi:preprotein translocase subunit SecA
MNKQREVVYKKRREILEKNDAKSEILEYVKEEIENITAINCAEETEDCNEKEIFEAVGSFMPIERGALIKIKEIKNDKAKNMAEKVAAITEYLLGITKENYGRKEQELGTENMRSVEKAIILETIDTMWMNHLDEIDYLREGIGLRGYGQRDPLIEYKREAFSLFSHLMNNIRSTVVNTIFKVSLVASAQESVMAKNLSFSGGGELEQFSAAKQESSDQPSGEERKGKQMPIINKEKIGRNDPCPCGAKHPDGRPKKYKHCHGK